MKSDVTISKSSGKVVDLEAVNSELTELALFEQTKSAPRTCVAHAYLTGVEAIILIYSCKLSQFLHTWWQIIWET